MLLRIGNEGGAKPLGDFSQGTGPPATTSVNFARLVDIADVFQLTIQYDVRLAPAG